LKYPFCEAIGAVDLPTTFGSSRGVSRMGSQGDRFKVTLPAWIVINTHAHREHMALDNLHRQDFEAYCPMIRKRRSHARRIESVLRPLFPNYLFVLASDPLDPRSARNRTCRRSSELHR
jgi:transcription termination factor NusG